ncbi:MAG TPA: ABC transporter permease [Streptosporangiaceae bacterium]|nr:ABC transporter permease [Streptosporangiaceae bacterium]
MTLAALAVLAVALAVTGMNMAHLYNTSGVAGCQAHSDCAMLASSFLNQLKASISYNGLFYFGIGVLLIAPAIIGVFWGAPLVTRELEAGTFRLTWNQSVTRTRWLAVKLGFIGLAAMTTAGLLSLMVTWWASPIDRASQLAASRNGSSATTRFVPVLFDARGIAPIGYAVFAFVLGVTAGVLIRRTVPAMAVTLAVFTAVQIVMPLLIRPHLITPVQHTAPLNAAAIDQMWIGQAGQMKVFGGVNLPGAWVVSNQTISPDGHAFTGPATAACESNTAPFHACQASIARLHLRQVVTYQPASRYWAFQWYETGIFLVLAVGLAGFCFWWLSRRRIS